MGNREYKPNFLFRETILMKNTCALTSFIFAIVFFFCLKTDVEAMYINFCSHETVQKPAHFFITIYTPSIYIIPTPSDLREFMKLFQACFHIKTIFVIIL